MIDDKSLHNMFQTGVPLEDIASIFGLKKSIVNAKWNAWKLQMKEHSEGKSSALEQGLVTYQKCLKVISNFPVTDDLAYGDILSQAVGLYFNRIFKNLNRYLFSSKVTKPRSVGLHKLFK